MFRRLTSCPALVIVITHEGTAELHLLAESFEDEQALRIWLRTANVLGELPDAVLTLLDSLDDLDWPTAA
jgi:hypothetical protein